MKCVGIVETRDNETRGACNFESLKRLSRPWIGPDVARRPLLVAGVNLSSLPCIKASHHCMTTRGVHKPDSDLVTSRMLVFRLLINDYDFCHN